MARVFLFDDGYTVTQYSPFPPSYRPLSNWDVRKSTRKTNDIVLKFGASSPFRLQVRSDNQIGIRPYFCVYRHRRVDTRSQFVFGSLFFLFKYNTSYFSIRTLQLKRTVRMVNVVCHVNSDDDDIPT